MTKQEIASLAVKILALYVVINSVITTVLSVLPELKEQLFPVTKGIIVHQANLNEFYLMETIKLAFPIFLALLLWNRADWLGRIMVRNTKEQKIKTPINANEILTLILSAAGLFTVLMAIPQFITFFTTMSMPLPNGNNPWMLLIELEYPLLNVIIGGVLLRNASYIASSMLRRK